MSINRFDGDLYVAGAISANAMNIPDNSIGSASVRSSSPIETDKQYHLHVARRGQPSDGSPIDETVFLHVALAPGTVDQFQAGLRTAITGNSTITVDLKKNGVSILSDIIDLDNSIAAYASVVGGLNVVTKDYAIGDVFEAVVTVTDGTGTPGEGLFIQGAFNEGPF